MNNNDISGGVENIPIPLINNVDESCPNYFEYTATSIPSASLPVDDMEIQYCGCKCELSAEGVCTTKACQCLQLKNAGLVNYNAERQLISVNSNHPIYECNGACLCSTDRCSNRVVQRGIQVTLFVSKSEKKGWSLHAGQPITKGTFVCEYAGEILTYPEAKLRILAQDGSVVSTYVDPTSCGNVGRFANHSCQPNLIMLPVRVDNPIPKLALFAVRHIDSQEELTFDYSGNSSTEITSDKPCFCFSSNCKQYLPFDNSLFVK